MMITRRRGRRGRRGLTLIELMVGVFIALFLTAAAVVFASHETKLLGYSTEQVDMQQQSRAAIDLLTNDLQLAGAGVGYAGAGALVSNVAPGCPTPPCFMGILSGAFTVPGGLTFNQAAGPGTILNLSSSDVTTGAERMAATYALTTHDMAVLYADGPMVTAAQYSGGGGEVCDATNAIDAAAQLVVFRTEDALVAQTFLFNPTAIAGVCQWGQCSPIVGNAGQGCRAFAVAADPNVTFRSDASAVGAGYTGGEVHTGFKMVAWFVQNNNAPDDNLATLRRAVFDGNLTCGAGTRGACGGEQAYNVETLQYQVWRFDPPPGAGWTAVPAGPIATTAKLRVDVELVVRQRVSDRKRHVPIQLRLSNQCVPNNFGCPPGAGAGDFVLRRVHRWSVEVRNSCRQGMRGNAICQ